MQQREFVGQSEVIRDLRTLIARVARSKASAVLLYGETGTGKGLVAQELHRQSDRARKPFVDVNCATIPAELFDQELFGQDKGTLAGALMRKNGLINAANGGSLFLDEIRQLDHLAQSKLLGLLDRKSFRRTGAVSDVEVDVRYICATNQILFDQVKKGLFRDDLYYRLQVVSINLPPLRERGDDCLILADYFIKRLNRRYGRTIRGWETAVADVFRAYHWPGNVRELENLLERIFVLESEDVIKVRHIPPRIMREVTSGTPPAPRNGAVPEWDGKSFQAATDAFQIQMIRQALSAAGGRKADAAATLGLSRHALRHQMNRLGVR
ncbi:sigma-54 dependent transcriptional regulator [Ovoidimarina sediminis]|uniref:sigma-54 dependent transcriptional regulator n=1 Tax=Ovoidimarina sediminis TaxID=3079856 RepID=UPI00290C2E2F|nr:sigma-54 dependent transcriptional regulator [Rhodophyticola sp. MJ-SS7]MDU8941817.1 sigma-54 dependent transcriptional regulator [Rhodophyticola sp. MJ-SS7]